MSDDPRLSEELQTYIDVLKGESVRGKTPEQQREDLKLAKMVEIMIDDIIRSREIIGNNRLKKLEVQITHDRRQPFARRARFGGDYHEPFCSGREALILRADSIWHAVTMRS